MGSVRSSLAEVGRGLWRSFAYAGAGLIIPVASALLPVAAWLRVVGDPWSWVNPWSWAAMAIIVTFATLLLSEPVAMTHRALLHRWSGVAIDVGYRTRPEPVRLSTGYWWNGYSYERSRRDALLDQRWRRITEPAYWREVRWALLAGFVISPVCSMPLAALVGAGLAIAHPSPPGIVLGALLLTTSAVTAPLTWRAVAPLAQRWLQAPHAARQRIPELVTQRAEMIATHDAEIRRIERDLHDGAQARLVAVGLDLATAERLMRDDPAQALVLLRQARKGTSSSLAELRELVRGVYPSVLIERGAIEAIRAVALDSPAPVRVDAPDDLRLPSPLEAAIYFAVVELITNAVKHAPHARIDVVLRSKETGVETIVRDDGPGGAVVGATGGLAGVRRRLSTFDATLSITSPAGGPTQATMWVPCESS
jgi:signal transduction histidine kinase